MKKALPLLLAVMLLLSSCAVIGRVEQTIIVPIGSDGLTPVTAAESHETIVPVTLPEETTTAPETTVLPETTTAPETTVIPETTIAPETTVIPETTVAPETTVIPETTVAPETTVIPETTAAPETTVAPETTATPETTYTSTNHVMEVIDGITYIDGIMIVNKTYSLPSTYKPGALVPEVTAAYQKLRAAAAADGLNLFSKSAYRSYISQRIIYEGYVAEDGQAAADRYSARPGHSEHQSGYAIDMNSTSSSFADTPEGIWLAANCARFGFIIRYPEGKEAITGYMYEPWHIRYVGVELATLLTDSGLTLEEYFGITSSYE